MNRLNAVFIVTFLGHAFGQAPLAGFRPPSVPLLAVDPFINVWSMSDRLYEDYPKYWDASNKTLLGIIRIDANVYRFMGSTADEFDLNTLTQNNVTVWPTRTIYEFQDPLKRVLLKLQFTTPFLPEQWDISSRPVTYMTFHVSSTDGGTHSVQLYYDMTGEIAVNSVEQEVDWNRFDITNAETTFSVLEIGTASQNAFDVAGDAVGIDWGHAYLAAEQEESMSSVIAGSSKTRTEFIDHGVLPNTDDANKPRKVNDDWPVLSVAWDFLVEGTAEVVKVLTFAYDDDYSIKYFGEYLLPYWRRPAASASIETLLLNAVTDCTYLLQTCENFDVELYGELEAAGGAEFATLAALAYRQTMTATKLVWNNQLQTPWAFMKAIGSNGFLSSIDVIAAASPLMLYQDPAFLELLLLPLLAYANNETGYSYYNYTYNWAPHNLGYYPVASIVSSQQENMPMEETGNIFILLGAITNKLDNKLLDAWYPHYWPLLQSWADYLVGSLPDPIYQLSADTFQGGSSHNSNLALKGIIALGAFSQICNKVGQGSDANYYFEKAEGFADQWINLADDGDHYRLQYDLSNTWSMKYNLLYEEVLGLSIFSSSVASEEVFYYMNQTLNEFGIPLDNRANYSRLSWTSYVAAFTTDTTSRDRIFQMLYHYVNDTEIRSPLPDWYDTYSGEKLGFIASPAVGALYSLMII